MEKPHQKWLSYFFIKNLIFVICVLDILGIGASSLFLLISGDHAHLLSELSHQFYLAPVYFILVILNVLLLILAMIRWLRHRVNKMYLIAVIFSVLMLLIAIDVFPLIRLNIMGLLNQKIAQPLSEISFMNYVMNKIFMMIVSVFLSVGMLVMNAVISLQIRGKVYFPRWEEK